MCFLDVGNKGCLQNAYFVPRWAALLSHPHVFVHCTSTGLIAFNLVELIFYQENTFNWFSFDGFHLVGHALLSQIIVYFGHIVASGLFISILSFNFFCSSAHES